MDQKKGGTRVPLGFFQALASSLSHCVCFRGVWAIWWHRSYSPLHLLPRLLATSLSSLPNLPPHNVQTVCRCCPLPLLITPAVMRLSCSVRAGRTYAHTHARTHAHTHTHTIYLLCPHLCLECIKANLMRLQLSHTWHCFR